MTFAKLLPSSWWQIQAKMITNTSAVGFIVVAVPCAVWHDDRTRQRSAHADQSSTDWTFSLCYKQPRIFCFARNCEGSSARVLRKQPRGHRITHGSNFHGNTNRSPGAFESRKWPRIWTKRQSLVLMPEKSGYCRKSSTADIFLVCAHNGYRSEKLLEKYFLRPEKRNAISFVSKQTHWLESSTFIDKSEWHNCKVCK